MSSSFELKLYIVTRYSNNENSEIEKYPNEYLNL